MKVVCIVQARMGSERLPGKVIKPIMGKPMVLYTLDRLRKSRYIDEIVLATSDLTKDNPLAEIVKEAGYGVFRGEEGDVLKRYKDASDLFEADIVIRITGDCPLVDPYIVDNVISRFLMMNYDYIRLDVPNTFVRGFDVEIFSKEALEKTYSLANEEKYREHVTLFMYNNPQLFSIGYVDGSDFYSKDYRLCVDTPEDFQLVENIFNHFKDEFVTSKEVIKYLDENKEIAQINLGIEQKKL